MAASVFFNWPTAKRVGMRGQTVRRNDWTTKWWKYHGGLWWLITDAETRVVRNTDYTRVDLRALDWTNMPPDCVTTALAAAGNACPAVYDPVAPLSSIASPAPGTPPGTTTGGTSSGGAGSSSPAPVPPPDFPTAPDAPPAPTPPPGPPVTDNPIVPVRVPKTPPTVTITDLMDSRTTCYDCSGFGWQNQTTTISGTVHLAGGSESSYAVSVRRTGGGIVAHGTIGPGGSLGFADTVTSEPGHTCRYTATAWAPGSPDASVSASINMHECCSLIAWFPGFITPTNKYRTGTEYYDTYPGGSSSITYRFDDAGTLRVTAVTGYWATIYAIGDEITFSAMTPPPGYLVDGSANDVITSDTDAHTTAHPGTGITLSELMAPAP